MCRLTVGDVHPPLYYFFTQILYHIFGNHGYTYHLSALIPYGIILVLACTVVRKWFGMIPAAVLVTLSSFTSSAILYNVEARMYSLGALCVLALILHSIRFTRRTASLTGVYSVSHHSARPIPIIMLCSQLHFSI